MLTHIKNKRLHTSPFILATICGLGALGFDIMWIVGELSTHFGIFTEQFYVYWRFVVLFGLIVSFGIGVYAIVRYVRNGYVRQDNVCELNNLRNKRQQEKRNRVFK
jgi:hypothetical protein